MSKPDAWMPLWIGDYQADTNRLTLEQHGAYLLLLMDYWRNGAPPDDDELLGRILSVSARFFRSKLRPFLAPFFTLRDGRWLHGRVERELAGARERSGKAATKAKMAAEARWSRERTGAVPQAMPGASAEALHEQCPSPVTYSVPTEQAPSAASPDKESWDRAVALLTKAGRATPTAARSFFGKLLSDHRLEARDLLPSVVKAEGLGTHDPQAYLRQAAKAVADRRGNHAAAPQADVSAWDIDHWRIAYREFLTTGDWGAMMGPRPGDPGCMVPREILLEAAA